MEKDNLADAIELGVLRALDEGPGSGREWFVVELPADTVEEHIPPRFIKSGDFAKLVRDRLPDSLVGSSR